MTVTLHFIRMLTQYNQESRRYNTRPLAGLFILHELKTVKELFGYPQQGI